MMNNILKFLKSLILKLLCFWCVSATVALFGVTKFYAQFLERLYTKSIKDILGFEVTCIIGLLAVIIALAALKPVGSQETKKIVHKYQFKTVIASFFTLALASTSYIYITIIWGYSENGESYNNWALMVSTGLFIYTLLTSFVTLAMRMDAD